MPPRAVGLRATKNVLTASIPRPGRPVIETGSGAGAAAFTAYDPPIAKPQPPAEIQLSTGIAQGYEASNKTFRVIDIANVNANPLGTPVYSTKKKWQGIDVHVAMTGFAAAGLAPHIIIAIFAVTRGVRTLVASGRTIVTAGRRIASARVICDSFDVVVARVTAPLGGVGDVTISTVASNECVEDDNPLEGSVTAQGGPQLVNTQFTGPGTSGVALVPPELCFINADNNSGAARWYMVFDQAAGPVVGDRPRLSFAMPIASTLYIDQPGLRALRYVSGLFAGPSTTGGTYTPPGAFPDIFHQVMFR